MKVGQKPLFLLPLMAMLFSCQTVAVSSSAPSESSSVAPTLREAIVANMRAMATFRWTPSETISYYDGDASKKFVAGTEYVGLPYTMGGGRTTTMGDPLGNFKKKLDEDGRTYIGPTAPNEYYGCDCSSAVEGSWRLSGFDTGAIYTGAMIPGENKAIYAVGNYDYSSRKEMTKTICSLNGKEKMFSSYAQLNIGDAVVRRVPSGNSFAGHVRLIAGIDAQKQEITVIEQCGYGIDGQTQTTWRLDRIYTYQSLFDNAYIPITPMKVG